VENLGKILKNQQIIKKNQKNTCEKLKIWRNTLNSEKYSPNFGGKIRKNTQNSEKYSKNVFLASQFAQEVM